MTPRSLLGAVVGAVVVCAALVLQVTLFPHFAWDGVVPNLVLLVVVGAALARGAAFGMVLGFLSGVALDLAPPADHVAGRWALALVLVGWVAGRVRPETRTSVTSVVATVAVCSLLGTSVFALSGLLIGDLSLGFVDLLRVVGLAVLWDVVMTPLVLPLVMRLFEALAPPQHARA